MFSIVSFVIGMLVAWFAEWLYVYVTKNKPRNDKIRQLEAKLQENSQAHTEAATKLNSEIETLQAEVEKLSNECEVATAEADGLRGELDAIRQPQADTTASEVTAAESATATLDEDTELEQEFAAAMAAPAPEGVDDETGNVNDTVSPAVNAEPGETDESEENTGVAAESEEASAVIVTDDLTRLTGIGPKTADLLNNAGVISFAQLAAMNAETLHTFLQENNIPHSKAKIANWPEQAAQMAG